jgi:photosystem II stability/assembly factor-like uncharacterized protein
VSSIRRVGAGVFARGARMSTVARVIALAFCLPALAWTGVRIEPQSSGVDVRLRGISAVDGEVAWASGRDGKVLRTLDGGKHWQAIAVPDAGQLDFRDIEGFDADTAVILGIGPGEASRIYRTDDGGRTWKLALQNRDPRAFFDCMVFDGQRGWMLGDPVESRFQVYATVDGGRNWALSTDGPQAAEGEAAFAASGSCIARVGTKLVVATGGTRSRIHFREDTDRQWMQAASLVEAGSASKGVFSMAALARTGGFIAVGGDFHAEKTPANAARFSSTDALVLGHGDRNGRILPEHPFGAGLDATALPATPGYRSGVACNAAGTTCIAVGPSGVDAWNGSRWEPIVTAAGYDAIDIAGNAGWASGDGGRIARIDISD